MKNKTGNLKIAFIILPLIITGCATIIKGYESPVELYYVSDSLRVYTSYGEEIPIIQRRFVSAHLVQVKKLIFLRSDRTHILHLKSKGKEKIVTAYPKISAVWLGMDLVCGVFPVFIDMFTGSWHHFDDINAMVE